MLPVNHSGTKPVRSGLITIDVEPDNVWQNTQSRSLNNLAGLQRFHQLCVRFGIRPTYLITYSVATDARAAQVLEGMLTCGECEIGMHAHFWETPPLTEMDIEGPAWVGPHYPVDVLAAKLATLHQAITKQFGPPTSHRAGRWGFDARQVGMLSELGVTSDTSVTPGINWRQTGVLDYTTANVAPYYLSHEDITRSGSSEILEVPCTIKPGLVLPALFRNRLTHRLLTKIGFSPQWLRTSPGADIGRMLGLCQWAIESKLPINIMSHSSEFLEKGSPYWRSADDIEEHFAQFEVLFKWWAANDVRSLTLSQYRKVFSAPIGTSGQ